MSPVLARLSLVAAAVLFSVGGAGIKGLAFTPWQVAGLRSAAATLALLALVPRARPAWLARRLAGAGGRTPAAAAPGWTRRAWMVGVVYAATMCLFVLANRTTTAANTVFLQSSAPLYILVLGPWLLHERFRGADLVTLALMGIGLTLFFLDPERPQETAPDPLVGNALALAAGVTWALTVMGLRWMARAGDVPMTAVVAGNVLACLFTAPFLVLLAGSGAGELGVDAADWALVAALGVFQIGLAYVFLDRGLRHVPALEASLLLLVEPVLNPLWAWLSHGERPGTWAILGGGLILGASVLRAALESARRAPPPAPARQSSSA